MRAVQLKSVFSSLCVGLFLLSFLSLFSGCGESNYSNYDPDKQAADEPTPLASPGEEGAKVREYWTTLSDVLYDNLIVQYKPINEPGATLPRSGGKDSIIIHITLLETDESHKYAYGSFTLDEDTSLTGHPLEVIFEKFEFEADATGIRLSGDTVLTTKTEGGNLIQPSCRLNMSVKETSGGRYICQTSIEIPTLNYICESNIEIYQTGGDDPNNIDDYLPSISFSRSSWAKKNKCFTVSYPRKLYNNQQEYKAFVDEDVLTLSHNITDQKFNGMFRLPAALSPNGSAITITLEDVPILGDIDYIVNLESTGKVDTVNFEGEPVNVNYLLLLKISNKIKLESQEGGVRLVDRYTLTASLELFELNVRTNMMLPVSRTDEIDVDENGDGFHDNYIGSSFVLPGGETYSVTHQTSTAETADIINVPYEQVEFNLSISDTGSVAGKISLPQSVTPEGQPFIIISLDELEAQLDGLEAGTVFKIGTPDEDGGAQTKIVKTHLTPAMEVIFEENGRLYLTITQNENGSYSCYVAVTSDDKMTRIIISDMEVNIKVPPTADNQNITTWDRVASPRQIVTCTSAGGATDNILFESDVAVNLSLSRQWKNHQERIVASGEVLIQQNVDCLGAPLAIDLPANTYVDVAEGKDGFTLIGENDDFNVSINLVKTAANEFEYQVYILKLDPGEEIISDLPKLDPGDEINFDLPAERTSGTGFFVTNTR